MFIIKEAKDKNCFDVFDKKKLERIWQIDNFSVL